MEKKKLLLMYNPTSGRAKISRQLADLLELFFDADYAVTVSSIRPPYGAEEILTESEPFDMVVCCGGDGTLNHTVNGLMQLPSKPLLGYLPCGSTNDFAATLGLGRELMDDCRAITKGEPFCYDIGSFNGERYFNYIAAFGAFTEVSYTTSQAAKNSLGYLAYIIEGVKHLPFDCKYHAKITLDDTVIEDDFLYGAFSNSLSVGGIHLGDNLTVKLNDGIFETLLIRAPRNVIEMQNTVGKLLSRDFSSEEVRLIRAQYATFEFDEPIAWTLDGEAGGSCTHCSVGVVPSAITIMRPKDAQ